MTRVRFTGFPTGQPVALSVTDTAGSDEIAVPAWSESASAAVRLVRRTALEIAPDGCWFECDVSEMGVEAGGPDEYDPQFHDIEYEWEIAGESGSYSAPQNLIAAHKAKNRKYGKRIAHVFANPGSYSLTCIATNILTGQSVTSPPFEITVKDPDIEFTPAETYIVSNTGFAGAPAHGDGQEYSKINDAKNAIQADQPAKARILIKRGTAYDGDFGRPGNGMKNVYVATWGSGPRPLIEKASGKGMWLNGSNSDPAVTDFVVSGISINGGFDPTVDDAPSDLTGIFISDIADVTAVMHDLDLYGCATTVYAYNLTECWGILSNCVVRDWSAAGHFGPFGASTAIVGNRFTHDPNSYSELSQSGWNGGFGIRLGGESFATIVSQHDAFNRMGWFNSTGTIGDTQPALRLNTTLRPGARMMVERVSIEGTENSGGATSQTGSRAANLLIDRMFWSGTHDALGMYNFGFGGVTMRNSIGVKAPSRTASTQMKYFLNLRVDGNDNDQENLDAPVRVYNSSFVFLRDGSQTPVLLRNDAPYNNVAVEHCVLHIPNADVPIEMEGLDDASLGWNHRMIKGYYDAESPELIYTRTPNRVIDFIARTGSFTEGATLTGGASGTEALIYQIQDEGGSGRLYLGPLAGAFFDGEPLVDSAGGSATAVGPDRYSGVISAYCPFPDAAIVGTATLGLRAVTDFFGNRRPDAATPGACEPG